MRALYKLLPLRDWVYLLALLIPVICLDLILKMARVIGNTEVKDFWSTVSLMRSDLLFDLGYTLFWIGIFIAFRKGIPRKIALILVHAISLMLVLLTTSAYVYFFKTGSILDYSVLSYAMDNIDQLTGLIGSHANPTLLAKFLPIILYVVAGPWAFSRLIATRNRSLSSHDSETGTTSRRSRPSLLYPASAFLLAFSFIGFSISMSGNSAEGESFARETVVNLAMSRIDPGKIDSSIPVKNVSPMPTPTDASLVRTPKTDRKNVVFIHLESTRAESVTPYNPSIDTTPYLDKLAKKSIFASDAYTIVPHTSKAITAVNCGIYPHLTSKITEAQPGGVPANCLPNLLDQQGYNTVTFQSATADFEDRASIIKNFGYNEFYPLESLPQKGFEKVNYFGREDNIMLKPSEQWIEEHSGKPFMMTYLGVTAHDNYLHIDRYGFKHYTDDGKLNRYLNDVNYLDHYVKNIMEMYKRLGLYKDTVFVIYGDHGEGFGEHGLYQHDNTIYTEGIKIPLMVVDPGGKYKDGERVKTPTDELDVVPTVLDLLGYKVTDGSAYQGRSMLAPPKMHRTLHFSCWDEYTCLASVKDNKEYIYFFGNKPEEVYDLKRDPYEKHDIVNTMSRTWLDERRTKLLKWYSRVNAAYERTVPSSITAPQLRCQEADPC